MRTFWLIVSLVLIAWLAWRPEPGEEGLPARVTQEAPPDRISRLVAVAHSLEGKPYRGGGSGPVGFDCSGFVRYVYQQEGLTLPRSSVAMRQAGPEVPLAGVQAGDLLFFTGRDSATGETGHVALVTGVARGRLHMTHACARGVVTDDYYQMRYYQARFLSAVRPQVLMGDAPTED